MNSIYRMTRFSVIVVLIALAMMPVLAHPPASTQEGWFSVIHWVPRPGSTVSAENLYILTFDDGHKLQLDVSREALQRAGGLNALKGKRVRVTLNEDSARSPLESGSRAAVSQIELAPLPLIIPEGAGVQAVSGSQPWVTIMCEFPGSVVGQDTDTLAYFQDMYSADYPGMDHYWRTQSFGKVNLLGSNAYGWFTLPHSQTYYFDQPGSGTDYLILEELALDCINAATATVDFTPYVGINFMFNGELNCCAWGGGDYLNIDGVTKLWRLTWNPPWSWRDITVVAHEVGHGFGLPHANNYDNDNWPYDSPWDVMSDTHSFCNLLTDPDYGCLGQHTNAYHKDSLGWFAPEQRLVATSNTGLVTLDHVAMQNPDDLQVIIIPVPSSTVFYVVEARQTVNSNYDAKLPGKAVIIHEIDESRLEPAWLVGGTSDALSGSVTTGVDGAWLVGEEFAGPNFKLTVESETTDGFVVSVTFDETNLVINGGMEGDTNGDQVPDGWTGKGLLGDKLRCDTVDKVFAYADNCAFQFKGSVGEKSSLSQSIDLTGKTFSTGDTLQIGAFINASNVATSASIKLKVVYSGDTKEKGGAEILQTAGYQQVTGSIALDSGSISKIKVQVQNRSVTGKVYVDNIGLWVNP
jgi:M6 family metalloprotease-like protein